MVTTRKMLAEREKQRPVKSAYRLPALPTGRQGQAGLNDNKKDLDSPKRALEGSNRGLEDDNKI